MCRGKIRLAPNTRSSPATNQRRTPRPTAAAAAQPRRRLEATPGAAPESDRASRARGPEAITAGATRMSWVVAGSSSRQRRIAVSAPIECPTNTVLSSVGRPVSGGRTWRMRAAAARALKRKPYADDARPAGVYLGLELGLGFKV